VKRTTVKAIAALFAIVCSAMAQQSASTVSSPQCYGLSSQFDEPLRVGRIVGNGPAFFQEALTDCETAPNHCQTPGHSYLIPGDLVVVAGSVPNFLCVEYSKKGLSKRRYLGWIPAERIKFIRSTGAAFPLSAWLGTWASGTAQKIVIRADGSALQAKGDAWWQGLTDPHFGDFRGVSVPTGNLAVFEDNPCRVQMVMISRMIAAEDNGHCGGMNVTFTGFYIRNEHLHFPKGYEGN
jgi:hypothetical protein